MKTVTYLSTLMRLAHAEGQARLNGTEEEYLEAKRQHEAYKELCLSADKMVTGKVGDLL